MVARNGGTINNLLILLILILVVLIVGFVLYRGTVS